MRQEAVVRIAMTDKDKT